MNKEELLEIQEKVKNYKKQVRIFASYINSVICDAGSEDDEKLSQHYKYRFINLDGRAEYVLPAYTKLKTISRILGHSPEKNGSTRPNIIKIQSVEQYKEEMKYLKKVLEENKDLLISVDEQPELIEEKEPQMFFNEPQIENESLEEKLTRVQLSLDLKEEVKEEDKEETLVVDIQRQLEELAEKKKIKVDELPKVESNGVAEKTILKYYKEPKEIKEKKEQLKDSTKFRATILSKYGMIPCSVWQVDKSKNKIIQKYDKTLKKGRSYSDSSLMSKDKWKGIDTSKIPKSVKNRLSVSGMTCRGKEGGLSTFPYDVCERIYRFYSKKGDYILDPFSGRITRMITAFRNKRNYTGYDVSKEFYEQNMKVRDKLLKGGLVRPETSITLHFHTSEKMFEEDNSQDLIFSSPPYWNLEYYGDHPDQLGKKGETYEKFLKLLKTIFGECHRVLKKDKFCVINVNDFRKNGIFYIYHIDVVRLMKEVGFKTWDIIIMDWRSSVRQAFARDIEKSKIVAKQHEYVLVFKK